MKRLDPTSWRDNGRCLLYCLGFIVILFSISYAARWLFSDIGICVLIVGLGLLVLIGLRKWFRPPMDQEKRSLVAGMIMGLIAYFVIGKVFFVWKNGQIAEPDPLPIFKCIGLLWGAPGFVAWLTCRLMEGKRAEEHPINLLGGIFTCGALIALVGFLLNTFLFHLL